MPTGHIKWYDPEKGFGFVTNPGSDDVFIGQLSLPEGVTELHKGQKVEYEMMSGRKGDQVSRIIELGPVPEEPRRRRQERKFEPEQLQSMIQDVITLLEGIQPGLQHGRYPERKEGRQVADVLRAVARELDPR